MGYEVYFHPVGSGERSGDAISLRFGELLSDPPRQTVMVIDGGFQSDGQVLVNHIRNFYATNRVDIAVSTHPDADHSAGLAVVLEQLEVGQLVMHRPWNHAPAANMFSDGRVTDISVTEALRKSLDNARELERIAERRGISIVEPFTGTTNPSGDVLIVGPTQKYYEELLLTFRCTPEPISGLSILAEMLKSVRVSVGEVVSKAVELWNYETLTDAGTTSAENNSSAMVLVRLAPDTFALFTGDAGIPALAMAAEYLVSRGFDFSQLKFIQVPHHGSQHNVGPAILDVLVGPRVSEGSVVKIAFVSAAADGDAKHPYKKVMNAFRRRGAPVHATQGITKRYSLNAPDRGPLWTASVALPFYTEVED